MRSKSKRGVLPKHLRKAIKQTPMPIPLSPEQRLKKIQNEIYRLEHIRATMGEKRGAMRRSLFQCSITDRIAQMKEVEARIKKEIKAKLKA